jgi:hypothetical protein
MSIRVLHIVLWLSTLLAMASATFVAVRSFSAPEPYTVTELTVLDQAARLARHEAPYVEPAAKGQPALLPGFTVVVSMLVTAVGAQPWLPRAVALVSILVLGCLIAFIVRSETRSTTLGVAGAGLMVAAFGTLAGPPGSVGPEALMLIFMIAGCLALRDVPGALGAVFGAVMFSAAALTHPQGAAFAWGAFFFVVLERRQRALPFTLGMAVFGGGTYVLLSYGLGPWFNFNAWDLPIQSLTFGPARLLSFIGGQVLGTLGLLTLAALLSFALPSRPWKGTSGLWMCMAIAAVGGGALAIQNATPDTLVTLSTIVTLAMVGPIALQGLTRHLSAWPDSSRLGGQRVMLIVLTLQFVTIAARLSLVWY